MAPKKETSTPAIKMPARDRRNKGAFKTYGGADVPWFSDGKFVFSKRGDLAGVTHVFYRFRRCQLARMPTVNDVCYAILDDTTPVLCQMEYREDPPA